MVRIGTMYTQVSINLVCFLLTNFIPFSLGMTLDVSILELMMALTL